MSSMVSALANLLRVSHKVMLSGFNGSRLIRDHIRVLPMSASNNHSILVGDYVTLSDKHIVQGSENTGPSSLCPIILG